jgi:hypothetical protein
LQLPKGTVYSLFQPEVFHGLYIKTSEVGTYTNDWDLVPLIDGFIENPDSDNVDSINYDNFGFDLDCTVRDGSYEDEQLFAIYGKNDILKLIEKLTDSLK